MLGIEHPGLVVLARPLAFSSSSAMRIRCHEEGESMNLGMSATPLSPVALTVEPAVVPGLRGPRGTCGVAGHVSEGELGSNALLGHASGHGTPTN